MTDDIASNCIYRVHDCRIVTNKHITPFSGGANTRTRTHGHATPPHVGNTLALPRICAFRRCQGALTRSSVSDLRTGCSALRTPPPDYPGSLQPSGKSRADLQVSQQHADTPGSLHYLCHMAQPLESCIISLSFIILYFLVGAGGVWEAVLCPG